MVLYLLFLMLPIYWLLNMSLQDQCRDPGFLHALAAGPTFDNYARS